MILVLRSYLEDLVKGELKKMKSTMRLISAKLISSKLILAKLISAMGVVVLFLDYSSAALRSDLGKTVESNLKDVSAVGVLYVQDNANSCGLIVRRSQDSKSFDLAEDGIRKVFAQNNIPECDGFSEDQIEEVNLAIQMATEGFPRVASLGRVFTKISPGVVKWIGSTLAIGSGCATGVTLSVSKNEFESGEDTEGVVWRVLFVLETTGVALGIIISELGAGIQSVDILYKNYPKRVKYPPKEVFVKHKYAFGTFRTFMASVGSGFLCFEGWEYLEGNR